MFRIEYSSKPKKPNPSNETISRTNYTVPDEPFSCWFFDAIETIISIDFIRTRLLGNPICIVGFVQAKHNPGNRRQQWRAGDTEGAGGCPVRSVLCGGGNWIVTGRKFRINHIRARCTRTAERDVRQKRYDGRVLKKKKIKILIYAEDKRINASFHPVRENEPALFRSVPSSLIFFFFYLAHP